MKTFAAIIAGIIVILAVGLLIGFPIMWLWNGIVSDLLHLRNISFWEAVGLYILCQALFAPSNTKDK